MRKFSRWGLAVLLGVLLMILACTSQHKLYGRWKSTDEISAQSLGDLIFEFTKDGMLRISIAGVAVDLKYEFADADTLRFIGTEEEGGSLLAGQEVDWKVTGDTLILTSDQTPMEFIRLPEE